jgi:hypothetical protein
MATLHCSAASPKRDGRPNGISERKSDNERHGKGDEDIGFHV